MLILEGKTHTLWFSRDWEIWVILWNRRLFLGQWNCGKCRSHRFILPIGTVWLEKIDSNRFWIFWTFNTVEGLFEVNEIVENIDFHYTTSFNVIVSLRKTHSNWFWTFLTINFVEDLFEVNEIIEIVPNCTFWTVDTKLLILVLLSPGWDRPFLMLDDSPILEGTECIVEINKFNRVLTHSENLTIPSMCWDQPHLRRGRHPCSR